MTRGLPQPDPRAAGPRRRGGYSFVEVMFAVVVLGIGFIMIAAIFPVGIQQAQATSEESSAAVISRGAVLYLQSVATERNMPRTEPTTATSRPALVSAFNIPDDTTITPPGPPTPPANAAGRGAWDAVKGNLILPDNPRRAFVPLYKRENGASTAQVWLIAVEARARSAYEASDLVPSAPAAGDANLQPRTITVTISDGGTTAPDIVEVSGPNQATVGEGAYFVISDDSDSGTFNGRIYRVGIRRQDMDSGTTQFWELAPGGDYVPEAGLDGVLGNADDVNVGAASAALIVGRERVLGNPTEFQGTVQDIGIYTTFIPVRPQ